MGETRGSVVLASGNTAKWREIEPLLAPLGFRLRPQSAFGIAPAAEDGDSFAANALIKARHAARRSGLPAIAEDSGLVVAALDGAPGIRSARYAGPAASDDDNIERLLAALSGVPAAARTAAFHCVAVYIAAAGDPAPLVAEGRWPGRILEAPRGTGGFGYDPVFFDPQAGMAASEMTLADKNARSHRGRACRALADALARRHQA